MEKGGSTKKKEDDTREVPASKPLSLVVHYAGKKATSIGYGQRMGLEGEAYRKGQYAFNAVHELWSCRETFVEVKRRGGVRSGKAELDD